MLGEKVKSGIQDKWQEAVLNVKYTGGNSAEFSGFYFNESGEKVKNFKNKFKIPHLLAVKELHSLTTEGNGNRWNRLRYTIRPDDSFEADFIWDEDLAEEMAYIHSTADVPEPQRGAGLGHIKQMQLERKTARIYDALALCLLTNAPSDDKWLQLVLTLTQPPLHYEAHAHTAPGLRTALLLLGEEAAVQALEELTQEGDHLRWESATLTVEPTGQYRYSFVWAGAGEFNLPNRYYREGQVSLPPTAV